MRVYSFFRRLDRVCSSYLQTTKKAKKKLGLVHPIRTNLSLCIIFSVFALLNLRLHRRVKLLVLASSSLEFRVLFTVVTPPPQHLHHYCHIPPPIRIHIPPPIRIHIPPPLPYPTTNPSSFHIRFVLEIHLVFGFVFPCLRTPGQFLGQNFDR